MAGVADWNVRVPTAAATPPPMAQRLKIPKDGTGAWDLDAVARTSSTPLMLTEGSIAPRAGQGRVEAAGS